MLKLMRRQSLALTYGGLLVSLLASGCGGSSTNDSKATGGSGGEPPGGASGGAASGSGGSANASGGSGTGKGTGGASANGGSSNGGTGNVRTTGERSTPLPRPTCPETPPNKGTSCTNGLTCSYGDSPLFECRQIARCEDQSWVYDQEGCDWAQPATCPSADPVDGSACDPGDRGFGSALTCVYDDGSTQCRCYGCDRLSPQPDCATAGPRWICAGAAIDLDCPLTAPNIGEGCATPGKECEYGDPCSGGMDAFCRGGSWDFGGGAICGS